MNLKLTGRYLPIFLVIVVPMSLYAGEAGDGWTQSREELETVTVTATRGKALARDVSAALSQVNMKDVLERSPAVLAEMLRGEPGAFFQQTTPGQGIPIIRGLKGSQLLHLVDGMRLNNAFFRDAPNQYLGLVDAYASARMEVLRGAAGTLYGADAMGGVVQVLTPEPRFEGPEFKSDSRLYGAFNSVDTGWVARASTAMGKEGFSFSGGATYQDYSDRETGNGTKLVPSGYRAKAADAKFHFELDSDSDLMISAQALEQPSTPRIDELVPGYGQQEPASEQFFFQPNRRSFLHGRYRRNSQFAWLDSLELHLARQVITDDRLSQDFGNPVVTREANESRLDGLTLQLNSSTSSGIRLTWGFEFYADEVTSSRYRRNEETGSVDSARSRFPDGSTMDSTAAYLSAGWRLYNRLSLDAGLRYSVFDIHLTETSTSPSAELSPDDFTGDIHMVYAISDTLNLVANIGRGFRPPNIFDLSTLGPRPGNRFNVANTGLGPESVWSFDFGFKLFAPNWQGEVFLFYMDYSDKITSVATGEITPDGRVVVRSENRNQVTLYGLEAGLRWLPRDDVEAYFNLNYTRGEEHGTDGSEFPADRIPPINGKFGLVYRTGESWLIEPYVLFSGEQDRLSPRDVSDPRINPDGTPAWMTFNVNATWHATDKLDLGLRLENINDKSYREHGSGIDAPGLNIGLWINATF